MCGLCMDFQGNEFFVEVFEKQRPTFGINYRELNRLMMASKAYEREFQFYKDGIEHQMTTYCERVFNSFQELKRELESQSDERQLEVKMQQATYQATVQQIQEAAQVRLREAEVTLQQRYAQETAIISSNLYKFDQARVQDCLMRWKMFCRLLRLLKDQYPNYPIAEMKLEIKKIVIDCSPYYALREDFQARLKYLQEENANQVLRIEHLQNCVIESDQQKLLHQNQYQLLKNQNMEFVSRLTQQQLQLTNYSDRLMMYQQCIQSIFAVVESKTVAFKIDESKLLERNLDIISQLARLELKSLRKTREVIEQVQRGDSAYQCLQRILQRREIEVQTDAFGLDRPLEQALLLCTDPAMIQAFIKKPNKPGIVFKSTQTELTTNDLIYMEFRERELKSTIENLQEQRVQASQAATRQSKRVTDNTPTVTEEAQQKETKQTKSMQRSTLPDVLNKTNHEPSPKLKFSPKVQQHQSVYEKLASDGEDRQQRLKSMRDQLHDLERKHWVDAISQLSPQQDQNYITPFQSGIVKLQRNRIRSLPRRQVPKQLGGDLDDIRNATSQTTHQTSPRSKRADFFFRKRQTPRSPRIQEEPKIEQYDGTNERASDEYSRRQGQKRMTTTLHSGQTPFEEYIEHQQRLNKQRDHLVRLQERQCNLSLIRVEDDFQ